ncbi:MAG: fibronectin type III domain-containing protein, partial [Ilumatobacter sp.]|nr:fibronectin type III domain-containing protein [Ilumatobacter sp.]
LTYTSTVFRAGEVQQNKTRSIELARGGTWIALNNKEALFDMCDGGSLPSSLAGVSTTCQVVDVERRRDPSEVPYEVAVVQADEQVPASVATSGVYANPNSTSPDPMGYDDWLVTPDWTPVSEENKVWLPQLPVQATSSGGTRDTTMLPGTQDPSYASCRVFFPGTFSSPITIAEPAYFASGVYYFTQPITLESGADVVVGNGAEVGCTTDFEAISFAATVPDPLNMSGLGGTFVLGDEARIVVDDSAGGDIRFQMNQRYVSTDELSVAASDSVSIVSVNGTHEPLVLPEVLGDDLDVPGAIAVPASTVGTDGNPRAVDSGYAPSILTPKPTEPDAPTNVTAAPYRTGTSDWDAAFTVTWDPANENGSLITDYVVTSSPDGLTCSPPAPTLPDTSVQPGCTVTNLRHNRNYTFTVVATNGIGDSSPSLPSSSVKARTRNGGESPFLLIPDEPDDAEVAAAYSDGLEIEWEAPSDDGGSPIVGYEVRATEFPVPSGTPVTCSAWWDELSCVLPLGPGGLTPLQAYEIEVVAQVLVDGMVYDGVAEMVDGDDVLPGDNEVIVIPGAGSAPVQTAATPSLRVPEPILDFSTVGSGELDVSIAGYVSVPQGHVRVDASSPTFKSVEMSGGLVAGAIRLDTGWPPDNVAVYFDNPISQKKLRLRSVSDDGRTSDAIVQINRSGSLAINSWILQ